MEQFPIRVISERTGVPATTLRAWEIRHGLLQPQRTHSGHRLYSNEDVEKVRQALDLIEMGHPIREAAKLINGSSPLLDPPPEDHWQLRAKRLLKAVHAFDHPRLDSLYSEALSLYCMDQVNDRLSRPVLIELGGRWRGEEAGVAEEHFFSAYLRNKLGARLHHEALRARGPLLVTACLPGEYHELGLLMFSLAAIGHGYRVLYLGADLPLEQLPSVTQRSEAAAVVLSATCATITQKRLSKLVRRLSVSLFLGGSASEESSEIIEAAGAEMVGSNPTHALEIIAQRVPLHAN